MRIFSSVLAATLLVGVPAVLAACGDGDDGAGGDGDGDVGGAAGDGDGDGDGDVGDGDGDTGGGSGDGDGDTDGNGGGGNNGPAFSVEDCQEEDGPGTAVTGSGIGAFADSDDWMAGWTNWSSDSTPEDDGSDADVVVTADIEEDETWTADTIYSLGGNIHVLDGVTLTIEPGTLIKSGGAESSLIISRGGMLMAEGTAEAPIVFTSDAANGAKAQGQWGGIVILGNAVNWKGTETLVEGLPSDALNQYGGDDDEESSGTLTYVRIEFGGTEISDGNEINGLTMGSVGSGTVINHVMVSTTLDDGFEWFGGTVEADHLIVNDAGDDMFDMDTGYRGTVHTFFGRQISPVKDDPNGLEWDSSLEDADEPGTDITASKATLCGTGALGNPNFGAVFREQVKATIDDMVIVGFDAGIDIRDNAGTLEDPFVVMTNSWSWGHQDGLVLEEGDFDTAAWFAAGEGNQDLDQ